MVDTGIDEGPWLRPILSPSEHEARTARGEIFERGGSVVQPDVKLSQIARRRPPGITGHQWSSAIRTRFDFVVCDAVSYAPAFVVEFVDPAGRTAEAQRGDRMTDAVCEAIGLELLRVESSALRPDANGRRFVEYVIDARTFQDTATDPADPDPAADEPVSYRDIIGRLPDGRSGFVNDLGAVARAAAVDAYASRQLADPIIRGLHVCWKDGPAEGWGWLEVHPGGYIFERVRIWQHRFSCGIDPGKLAEDLAAAAIGERLKQRGATEPVLRDKEQLGRELADLRERRDEMENGFAFEYVSFD
jgi:hypothetical protein